MISGAAVRRLFVGLLISLAFTARGADDEGAVDLKDRIPPNAEGWLDLVQQFSRRADILTTFVEYRFFPFKKQPTVLSGEVRISPLLGLSLRYTTPEERLVIFDQKGMLVRDAAGGQIPPPDPRATLMSGAMFHILRFDLLALANDFELSGERSNLAWKVVLVPRDETLRRALGQIQVEGEAETVRRIEIRRSAKQHIDILIDRPPAPATFSAGELQRYFR